MEPAVIVRNVIKSAAVVAALGLALGCSEPAPLYGPCDGDGDCQAGLICQPTFDGLVRMTPCNGNEDCEAGAVCVTVNADRTHFSPP